MRRRLWCGALTVAVFFGPLSGAGGAGPSAAPSAAVATGGAVFFAGERGAAAGVGAEVDLVAAAGELAGMAGGVVDAGGASGAAGGAGMARLREAVAARASTGGKLWVLIVPDRTDLGAALRVVAGRLAPGEQDAVLVASRAGVRARVPGLAGATDRIDAAFEASRRELAADLPAGLAACARRLDETRRERRGGERMALLGLAGAGAVVGLMLLGRWGRFRVSQRGWERDAASAHARRVGLCQEKLQGRATPGDPAYDRLYAELKELSGLAPEEAAAGLDELARKLEAGGGR